MATRSENPTPIGRKLRELRGGLTQKEADARAGLSDNTWQRIELGVTTRPSMKTKKRISAAFGIDYDELNSYVEAVPNVERMTNEELDRLAQRLAPFLADRLIEYLERR